MKEIAVKRTEIKLKNEELVISNRETNMKEEEEKQITKKNYLNLKETKLPFKLPGRTLCHR